MTEFTEVLERIDLSRIAAYFLYGSEPMSEITDSFEERINKSYHEIFDRLEELFPSADRNSEDLQDAISKLIVTHSDVYLQMGVLIGFQLYKILDQGYHNPKSAGIEKVLKNYMASLKNPAENKTGDAPEENSILKQIFEERKFSSLEEALNQNEGYQNARKEYQAKMDQLEQCGLSAEQKKAVDKAVSAANATGSEYGAAAYQMGFHDARKLMLELLK